MLIRYLHHLGELVLGYKTGAKMESAVRKPTIKSHETRDSAANILTLRPGNGAVVTSNGQVVWSTRDLLQGAKQYASRIQRAKK